MRYRFMFLTAVACAALVPAASAQALPASSQPPTARVVAVGQIAHQTTQTPTGGQSDVVLQSSVAANPARPNRAVSVAEQGLQTTAKGVFGVALTAAVTNNDGASWTSGSIPGITTATGGRWLGVSWPNSAASADGSLYAVGALRQADCENGLGITRSSDGGRSWTRLVVVNHLDTCLLLDARSSLAEDDGPTSPHRGRLFLAWTQFRMDSAGNDVGQQQLVAFSDDHGSHWSAPVYLAGKTTYTTGTTVLVQPNGTVFDAFYESTDTSDNVYLKAQISHDGGQHFGPVVTITNWVFSTDGALNVRCCQPSAAADPVTGELYVAIDDARFRHLHSYDDAVVLRSPDGVHWQVSRADHVPTTSTQEFFTPQVAADNGTVYVTWTTAGTGNRYRQQVAVSHDRGMSFGPATTLGPDGNLSYAATATGFGYWLGDFTGLAAVGGKAFAAWPLSTRSKNPQHQTLWGATIVPANP
jgi:hypothetical protein